MVIQTSRQINRMKRDTSATKSPREDELATPNKIKEEGKKRTSLRKSKHRSSY